MRGNVRLQPLLKNSRALSEILLSSHDAVPNKRARPEGIDLLSTPPLKKIHVLSDPQISDNAAAAK